MAIRRKKSLIDSAAEFAETVLPTIEHAVDTARDKAGPILAEASALAQEKAQAAREAVEEAATDLTQADSSKGKCCGKGRLKKALIAGGLLAVVGVIVKTVLSRKQADDNWQSAYEPPAPPAHKAPAKPADPAAPVLDDVEAADEPVTDPVAEAAADEPTAEADVQADDDADAKKD
jgi:hypothetical protein